MHTYRRRILAVTAVLSLLLASGSVATGEVPARSPTGQTLEVPEALLDQGAVYYVTTGSDAQITVVSDAPLQRTTATCSRVVGYVVTPFEWEEGQSPLLAGALRIPVASLSTGLTSIDEMVQGPALLNAAEYPEITFCMTGVSDVKSVDAEKGQRTYTLTVAGQLQVKDKTLELQIPARLSLIPFTWASMGRDMGDLAILRAKIDLKLADVGIANTNRMLAKRIPEQVGIDVFLLASTVSPERNLDPGIKQDQFVKQLRFLTLVRDMNDPEKGYEFGRAYAREIWDDAAALNRLATMTLTEDGIKTRDLGFVLKVSQRANELTEHKDPAMLGTLAKAYHDKYELDEAVKWIRQATEHLEGAPPEVAGEIKSMRERYEAEAEKSKG